MVQNLEGSVGSIRKLVSTNYCSGEKKQTKSVLSELELLLYTRCFLNLYLGNIKPVSSCDTDCPRPPRWKHDTKDALQQRLSLTSAVENQSQSTDDLLI